MNQINYSNINCNARRNVFVHSLAQMGDQRGQSKNGGPAPFPQPPFLPLEPPLPECRTTRRRLKHTWLEIDRREWMVKWSKLRALHEQKNSTYWHNEIAACAGDSKKLWDIFHTVYLVRRVVRTLTCMWLTSL